MSKESDWYEQVTRTILHACREQLGYKEVRPKGRIPGESGTQWEIDATCYLLENDGMILVECRRHTTKPIDQEQVGGLVFRIIDTGAKGGLLVTPLGYQEGATLVAKARKVTLATLNADATEREYVLKVAERLFARIEGKGGLVVGSSATVTWSSSPGEFHPQALTQPDVNPMPAAGVYPLATTVSYSPMRLSPSWLSMPV
jgi:hypothetical protein